MTSNELRGLNRIALVILEKTKSNSVTVVYYIRLAERLLRPHQVKAVKEMILEGINNGGFTPDIPHMSQAS